MIIAFETFKIVTINFICEIDPKYEIQNQNPVIITQHLTTSEGLLMCSISLENVISDCLSRALLCDTEPVSEPENQELGFESSTLKRFKETSSIDETSRIVMEYVLKGWPSEKEQVDELAREH